MLILKRIGLEISSWKLELKIDERDSSLLQNQGAYNTKCTGGNREWGSVCGGVFKVLSAGHPLNVGNLRCKQGGVRKTYKKNKKIKRSVRLLGNASQTKRA